MEGRAIAYLRGAPIAAPLRTSGAEASTHGGQFFMSHVPRNLTTRLAALCAAATLVGLAASSAEAASRGTLAASPGKPAHKVLRHHRVGAEIFTEQTVYSFQGGSDGTFPWGDLTQAGGALYSTTLNGGANGMG